MSLLTRLLIILSVCAGTLTVAALWVKADRRATSSRVRAEMDEKWKVKLNKVELEAKTALAEQKGKHDAEVKAVSDRLSVALGELQSRPRRTEQAVKASGTCPAVPACTGDRLARDDAEFLTRYAGRAALMREALGEARAGFETCRQALKEVTGGQHGDQGSTPPGVPGG